MQKRIQHIKLITILPFALILGVLTIGVVVFILSSTKNKSNELISYSTESLTIDLSQPHHEDIGDIVETYIFPNSVPSLTHPKFEAVEEAKQYLSDEALGIGIEIDGVSRFYPNQILIWHNAVNDKINNTPFLISYCPFCSSSVVYSRIVNNVVLEFETSTKLWNSNLLIRNVSESPSLWSSLIGESIYGDMSGEKLDLLKSDNITFKEWLKKYPETVVLSRDTGYNRPYELDPLSNKSIYEDFSNPTTDLDPKTFLSVVIFEENAYGVSMSKILKDDVSSLENTNIEVRFMLGSKGVQTILLDKQKITENEIENIIAPYFVIKAIYPNAQIAL